ncbi:cyclic nucleotide-binding domain-containing protein [Desulfobotulus mexicanus]|uniref:Cyclic nucleotide-binding domain-containing protein n=1 Tax=Desulfobotulus mexicanus TaxID=2586642 RepID=A0A5Q4VAP6_9BACT|nr:cyclic nucleotide-binding domain-containing protein [Desulfobotulus mexicanus]TYT74824.1 cyclic nucleotide-binding domain-containing protein [Desulfobotulus mexicanus]
MTSDKGCVLESLIAEGRKRDAMHLLCAMVGEAARQRDFVRAEALRKQMLQLDDMAIALIVEAGECIEQEKNQIIDGRHRENWKDLYSSFTPGERSAFFFACDPLPFSSGYFLFRQGEKSRNLFFVDEGCLHLIFLSGERHAKILGRVGPGEFAGEDTFFGNSLFCTASLVGLKGGVCRKLSLEALGRLEDDFPGFIKRIQAYCIHAGTTGQKLSARGVNRRAYVRIPDSGIIVFQLLCMEGRAENVLLKGLMSDISAGGLSFYVSASNDRAVRSLLGREIGMKLILQLQEGRHPVVCKGTVVGILPCQNLEYSVHVKFRKQLKCLPAVLEVH